MNRILILMLAIPSIAISGCRNKTETCQVEFQGDHSGKTWAIRDLNREMHSDWSSDKFLTFEFLSSTTHRFEITLHDKTGPRKLEILPFQGVWVKASLPLVHFQKMNTEGMDQASIWKTPRPGYWIGFTGTVGPITHIDSIGISMSQPVGTQSIELRNFRLTSSAEDTIFTGKPLVDEFGQWIPDEWPGKAKNLDDLKKDWAAEDEALTHPMPGTSIYGGFKGTDAGKTGFFHVVRANGIWWFADPGGCLFFSNGSCCIQPSSDLARTAGRKYIFSALPPDISEGEKGPDASFYTWNLTRRFGDGWYEKWIDLTARRMDSWGINTIANWSDPKLGASHRKAYVFPLEGWGIETGEMGMPDVYSPGYERMVDSMAALQCKPLSDDPYLLGYFIGNEPAWPGREAELAEVILAGDESPFKKALENYLAAGDTPERRKEFVIETFSKFLEIVCSAVKKYDPNHLNLGLRFGDPPSPEITKLSAKYFDVFSINHYGYSVSHDVIQKIYDLTGLPVIIGEFHFGVPGRGLAPGLAQTKDQEERAVAYRYYVENAAAHPALIGVHWFQWIDQPNTGRFDGENYNIGLVDVTDRPYPSMITAIKETFGRLQEVHTGKLVPFSRYAQVQ